MEIFKTIVTVPCVFIHLNRKHSKHWQHFIMPSPMSGKQNYKTGEAEHESWVGRQKGQSLPKEIVQHVAT